MIKYVNNNDNLIISHVADIDGIGCVILSKLVYENIDVILCEPNELEGIISDLVSSNYKRIYITDLSLKCDEMYEFINSNFTNVLHFDHHLTNVDVSKYSWSTVVVNIDDFLPSGTSLFYDYLLNNFSCNKFITSNYTASFVEAVRSYDTWDFKKTGKLDGKYLTEVFSVLGIDKFIDKYYSKIISNYNSFKLEFDNEEMSIVKRLEDDMKEYVDKCDESLIITTFLGYKVGISISENYRSEVGNVLSSRHKDLDFILIANFVRKSFSFRTTNDINLNEVAALIGGGGHSKAAGALMNEDNLKLFFSALNKEL